MLREKPDNQRAHDGERKAAQGSECGGGKSRDDDDVEVRGIQLNLGGDEDAAQSCKRTTDSPSTGRNQPGPHAVERSQIPVVHNGSHGHP